MLVEGILPEKRASPVRARAIEDLPEPDSPTRPRISPPRTSSPIFLWPRGGASREEPAAAISDFDLGGREKAWSRGLSWTRRRSGRGTAATSCARVGMARSAEDRRPPAPARQAAALQDGDPVGDARHKRKIVGNVERGNARLLAQSREQFQDTRAGDDVECGGRLVEEDESGWQPKAVAMTTRCFSPPEIS